MQIGIIGLGRMGANIGRRLMSRGHQVVGFDADAKLTFEVSDGVKPMQIYRAERIGTADAVRVYLSARPSSCKPRDRWLAQEKQQSCCNSKRS